MKKLRHLLELLIFLTSYCIIPNVCFSQLNTGLGYGYDTKGKAIATWSVGFEKRRLNVEGQIRPSLTRNVKTNNYIGGSVGYNLVAPSDAYLKAFSLIAYVGYFYDHVSSDKVILNKYFFSGALRAIKMINENGGLFLESFYINKSVQFSGGIHFKFD